MELKEINAELQRLEQLRRELLQKENEEAENHIKSLVWTQTSKARLEISPLLAAGIPKYKIIVYGPDVPKKMLDRVTVMGTSSLYEYNMLFSSGDFWENEAYFSTSSKEILLAFLKEVKFASLEYDKEMFSVLETAKNIYG